LSLSFFRVQTSLDPTHTCVKRLGLATMPLTVLVWRMALLKFNPAYLPRLVSISGGLAFLLFFLCLLAAKFTLSMLLMAHAVRVLQRPAHASSKMKPIMR
jgi:hypothetical protein